MATRANVQESRANIGTFPPAIIVYIFKESIKILSISLEFNCKKPPDTQLSCGFCSILGCCFSNI